MLVNKSHMMTCPVGRFAPSPTGRLHLGSLTTAVASYCHIKSLGGVWRLRMEDVDTQRCDPEYSKHIIQDLCRLGLVPDGDIIYQSQRGQIYQDYIDNHLAKLVYACGCSRKQLAQHRQQQHQRQQTNSEHLYPRLCLHTSLNKSQHKLRLQLPDVCMGFLDGIQGLQWQNPQRTQGDMVIKRANGLYNYILAVSIDDGLQGITHVMRGLDILPMTTAQIAMMRYANLPAVSHWYHLPLIYNQQGQKLSKQNLATPIDTHSDDQCRQLLATALRLLKQPPVDMATPSEMLIQATTQWDNAPLVKTTVLAV